MQVIRFIRRLGVLTLATYNVQVILTMLSFIKTKLAYRSLCNVVLVICLVHVEVLGWRNKTNNCFTFFSTTYKAFVNYFIIVIFPMAIIHVLIWMHFSCAESTSCLLGNYLADEMTCGQSNAFYVNQMCLLNTKVLEKGFTYLAELITRALFSSWSNIRSCGFIVAVWYLQNSSCSPFYRCRWRHTRFWLSSHAIKKLKHNWRVNLTNKIATTLERTKNQ